MRIDFEFSGGYGGLFARRPLALSLDSGELPAAQRQELTALVDASGIMTMAPLPPGGPPQGPPQGPPPGPPPGPQRDVFTYRLTISRGDLRKSFDFDDVTAPPALQPLLGFLRGLAIERQSERE